MVTVEEELCAMTIVKAEAMMQTSLKIRTDSIGGILAMEFAG
jgi:hypothetical protein